MAVRPGCKRKGALYFNENNQDVSPALAPNFLLLQSAQHGTFLLFGYLSYEVPSKGTTNHVSVQ